MANAWQTSRVLGAASVLRLARLRAEDGRRSAAARRRRLAGLLVAARVVK